MSTLDVRPALARLLPGLLVAAVGLVPGPAGADLAPHLLAEIEAPIAIATEPDGALLVARRDGLVLRYAGGALDVDPVVDLRALVAPPVGERGFAGLVVDPTDPSTLYLSWVDLDAHLRVGRWTAGDGPLAEPTTILRLERDPGISSHYAGWLGFDGAGRLWITTGDAAPQGDPEAQARDPFLLHGKVLRIDPSSDAFPLEPLRNYAIPAGNPFADGMTGAPEVVALGLRNPWRAAFDPPTGDLWLGDVGWNDREEVDRIPAGAALPPHFGWSCLEGTEPTGATRCDELTSVPPVLEYDHVDAPCDAVIGGVVYRGPASGLAGDYVFGDFCRGELWAARQEGATWEVRAVPIDLPWLVAFGVDASGNLYGLTAPPGGGGALWELRPTLLFRDGFESGGVARWSASVP